MSASTSEDDIERVKLARALANPSKDIRDETIKSLSSVLAEQSNYTELGMEKLWKALYYCMWLADKTQVQQELAISISDLLTDFQNDKLKKLFLVGFYRTLLREWGQLDQHRINKFYSLIRIMFRKLFSYLHTSGWPPKITSKIMEDLEIEVLSKTPNGLRFHIADIFLPEMLVATDGKLTTKQFLRCIKPFLNGLSSANDSSYHQRIIKRIFTDYLFSYATETCDINAVTETETEKTRFFTVKTVVLQGAVFDAASSDVTKDSYRQVLYSLHRDFQHVTGVQFYEIDNTDKSGVSDGGNMNVIGGNEGPESTHSSDMNGTAKSKKKKKKDKKRTLDGDDGILDSSSSTSPSSELLTMPGVIPELAHDGSLGLQIGRTTTDEVQKKLKKKKRKVMAAADSEEVEERDEESLDEHVQVDDEVVLRKRRRSSVKEAVPPVTPPATASNESPNSISSPISFAFAFADVHNEKQSDRKSDNSHSPEAEAEGSNVASTEGNVQQQQQQQPVFMPSSAFKGARPGYKFCMGGRGLGYYVDSVQLRSKMNTPKKSSAGKGSTKAAKPQQSEVGGTDANADRRLSNGGTTTNADRRLSTDSLEERRVRFGTPKSIDYVSSVNALKAATPSLTSTPSKSALKARTSFDGSSTLTDASGSDRGPARGKADGAGVCPSSHKKRNKKKKAGLEL